MAKGLKTESKKTNPFLWFIFAVIIPVIVALIIASVIFSIAGFHVTDWLKDTAKNIPVISSLMPDKEEENVPEATEQLQTKIDNKDKELEKLQKQLNESEDTIQSLKHKIAGIEKNTQQSTAIDTNEEIEMDTTEKFVGTFKNMDKAQAAQIIQSMDRDAAISVIAKMPNKTRGEILGAMDPKIAAEITEKLIGYKN